MKYQSEIVKEIIDSRGHEKSSLHYQSECIESWIDENKGSYPKLCDYEGEWLNYINENPIGEFPYETLTDVTKATINNVVPYEYKSAILSGMTLVNIFQDMDYVWNNLTKQDNFNYNDGDLIILNNGYHDGRYWNTFSKIPNIKSNTEYTLIFTKGSSPRLEFGTVDENGAPSPLGAYFNVQKAKITSPNNGDLRVKFSVENPTSDNPSINLGKVMFIEGDYTNVDIPYFEGMQSVRMPVLTTVGKNLFDFEDLELGDLSRSNGTPVLVTNARRNKSFISVDGSQNFSFSMPNYIKTEGTRYVVIHCYNINKEYISYVVLGDNLAKYENRPFLEGTKFVKITIEQREQTNPTDVFEVQLEYGKVVTTYEPYKSNILSCNEEVTLRGIGDVKDTLDLTTGELTQRIGEVVLDGSEDWSYQTEAKGYKVYKLPLNDIDASVSNSKANCLCDKYSVKTWIEIYTEDNDKTFSVLGNQQIRIQFNGSLEELKHWLSETKPTLQFLKTPTIKTVGLSVVNQDGTVLSKIKPIEGTMHITASGTPINPLFSGEIPVESITQNLASFIEE